MVLPLPLSTACACTLPSRLRTNIDIKYHIVIPFNTGGVCANVIIDIRRQGPRNCTIGGMVRLLSITPILLPIRLSF